MKKTIKDSGIEWVGDIPENWDTNTIIQLFTQVKNKNSNLQEQNLLSLSYGKIKRKDIDSTDGLLPESFDGYNIIDANDIVLRLTDLQNDQRSLRVGLATERGIVTSAYLTIRNRSKSLPRYLYYYLHAFDISKGFYGMGAGVRQGLSWDGIKWLKILSPSVEEQYRIVDFLDHRCAEIDRVIADTEKTIEEYKALKQSIITEAVTHGVRGPRPMKDSGVSWIGEIPVQWRLLRITRILDYSHPYPIGDGDHGLITTEDYMEEGIPYIRVQNIGWATPLTIDNIVYISPQKNEQIKSSILQPGDVLFAKTGATIGKTAIMPDNLPIANTTSHVGKITINQKYSAKFVFYLLSSYIGYRQFWDIACQKTTRPELSIDEIKTIRVILPDTRYEQDEIVEYLDIKTERLETLIANKQKLLTELELYKKSIIYEYVTGKKEVR